MRDPSRQTPPQFPGHDAVENDGMNHHARASVVQAGRNKVGDGAGGGPADQNSFVFQLTRQVGALLGELLHKVLTFGDERLQSFLRAEQLVAFELFIGCQIGELLVTLDELGRFQLVEGEVDHRLATFHVFKARQSGEIFLRLRRIKTDLVVLIVVENNGDRLVRLLIVPDDLETSFDRDVHIGDGKLLLVLTCFRIKHLVPITATKPRDIDQRGDRLPAGVDTRRREGNDHFAFAHWDHDTVAVDFQIVELHTHKLAGQHQSHLRIDLPAILAEDGNRANDAAVEEGVIDERGSRGSVHEFANRSQEQLAWRTPVKSCRRRPTESLQLTFQQHPLTLFVNNPRQGRMNLRIVLLQQPSSNFLR